MIKLRYTPCTELIFDSCGVTEIRSCAAPYSRERVMVVILSCGSDGNFSASENEACAGAAAAGQDALEQWVRANVTPHLEAGATVYPGRVFPTARASDRREFFRRIRTQREELQCAANIGGIETVRTLIQAGAILSVSVFEKTELSWALQPDQSVPESPIRTDKLNLFSF